MRKRTSGNARILLVGLLMASGAAIAHGQDNLLKNPSFEAVDSRGRAAEWSLSKSVKEGRKGEPEFGLTSDRHGGRRAASLRIGPALEWAHTNQSIWLPLAASEKYHFSVWLKGDAGARASIVLFALGLPPEPGGKIDEIQKREWIDVAPTWKQHTVGLRIDDTRQYVQLWCVVQLHSVNATLLVDDAELVRVGRPAKTNVDFSPTHSVGCARTVVAPVIDGRLNEAVWQRAGVAGGFSNLLTMNERTPSQQTETRLLYDDQNLYLAYRCFESDFSGIKARKTERDAKGLWNDDSIEVFIQPPDSDFHGVAIVGPMYYYLLVNAIGTRGDNIGLSKTDQWDGRWVAKTGREPDAWIVEMSIPFSALGGKPVESRPWRVNFTRTQKRLGENSSWAEMKVRFHAPERFGYMYFVKDAGDAAVVVAAALTAQARNIKRRWIDELSQSRDAIRKLMPRAGERAADLQDAQESLDSRLTYLAAAKPKEVLENREELAREVASVLQEANPAANAAAAMLASKGKAPLVLMAAPTMTNDRILPNSLLADQTPVDELALAACPGEYEPASFIVVPSHDISGLTVSAGPLASSKDTIAASSIDIKLVKCWYQAFGEPVGHEGVSFQRGKVLLPELLVNDDDLVRVDVDRQQNLLRVADPATGQRRYEDVTSENDALTHELVIRDADSLRPVNIPAGQARQFWVTVHVPADARPGTYRGRLRVACSRSSGVSLPLRIEVHPFRLASPVLEYSIFYRGKLADTDQPLIDSDPKTKAQYTAELSNMMAHGIDAPLCYQPPADMDLLGRALEIRKKTGVSTRRFLFCAWSVGPKDDRETSRRVLGAIMKLAKGFGYEALYTFGPDEPTAERVLEQIPPWRFLHELGWKVYLACNSLTDSTDKLRPDIWGPAKTVVDAFVVGGRLNPALADAMHNAGVRIYSYGNPQCGVEEPLTYRRNYGLALWKAGYSGAMNYAYQHGFGRYMWNDFDANRHNYRDHVMAYPTSDGVVDTLQWEGFREGVDDVRYLSTLLATIETAKNSPSRAERAAEVEAWVNTIDPSGDLDALRKEIVTRILELDETTKVAG